MRCYSPHAHDNIAGTLLCLYPSWSLQQFAAARRVRPRCDAAMRSRIPVTELAVKRGKTAVIVGAQWGDEGKGKIVDVLSESFSVVARYAGGHNAGHTVIINGKKFVLPLVPCGVLRPECKGVIGNGVVLDPMAFLNEVKKLKDTGVQVDGNLFVSNRA